MSKLNTVLVSITLLILFSCSNKTESPKAPDYTPELLNKIRLAASTVPGALPVRINYLKYAESIRKWSDIVDGGSNDPCKMARTVFQIVYPDGWIMVDAGMNRDIHHFFEKQGPQPFDDAKAGQVVKAIQGAKLVLITHEHGDHVGNAVYGNQVSSVNFKTVLTKDQVNTLIHNPHMPEIKLDENKSKSYLVVDFDDILPVAPGVVLIKAPGHTPGEIMVYTKLQSGKEFLFIGDVSWSYQGVEQNKPKPKSEIKRINEDGDQVKKELKWVNQLMANNKITILVSHDDIMLPKYAAGGLITDSLQLTQ